MGLKANSTIISNSAIVRYEPEAAWSGYHTETNNASVSLDFYGTDITAYGTGRPYAYHIYLDGKMITNYLQRHYNNSEVADYYRCDSDNPSEGFCTVLLEFHNLDPNKLHTAKITTTLGSPEIMEVIQWLVGYDTGLDETTASHQPTDLWPAEGSVHYTGSWSTLVGGDKLTRTSGDTCKFTFTGSGIEIFAMATKGNRIRVELDGETQEVVPTSSHSDEMVASVFPALYSRLGLNQDIPHNVTITNLIDASAENPLVNVTLKRMIVWKDSGTPLYTNTTNQPGNSSGSTTATSRSTSSTSGTSLSTPGSTVNTSTIAAIVVGCIAFFLILVIIWLVLRSRRRGQNADLTTKDTTNANIKQTYTDHPPVTALNLPAVYNLSEGASSQTRVWTIPPSILESQEPSRTIHIAPPRATGSSHAPGVSHQDVAREVLAEQKQEIGPMSPSTVQDTEDTQSVDEERVNRVILEVARRMGGVERTGLPPDYADLQNYPTREMRGRGPWSVVRELVNL